MEFEGVGAFVTGGASGLGEATARMLASRGAKVLVYDREAAKGKQVAADLGAAARFVEGDVTSEEQVSDAVDQAVDAFGPLRVVVNCAGIGTAHRTVGKDGAPFPLGLFAKTIEVNLIGTFNVIRLAAARMAGNDPNAGGERGVVVNTASVAAFDGQIGQAAYSASKGGIVGMTLPIARDLARQGIRVCTIAPGIFKTPLMMGAPQSVLDALGASVPFPPRLGEPPEFAALACHIVENPMLNGETIRLDGAIRMPPR